MATGIQYLRMLGQIGMILILMAPVKTMALSESDLRPAYLGLIPCLKYVNLNGEEIHDKLGFPRDYKKYVLLFRATYTTLTSEKCWNQAYKKGRVVNKVFKSNRFIIALRLPALVRGKICKVKYDKQFELDKNWRYSKYSSDGTYIYYLNGNETSCSNIDWRRYVRMPEDIPDSILIKLFKVLPDALQFLSKKENIDKNKLSLEEIGISTIRRTNETYYRYTISGPDKFYKGYRKNYNVLIDLTNIKKYKFVDVKS